MYGKVCFKSENYITELKDVKEKFDTILCLSLTKWIHLNYGDFGIKALFLKMYEQLEKGGILILEGHPWKSYKKNKKMNEWSKVNFQQIKLRPNLYKAYLEKIGFKFMTTFKQRKEGDEGGIDRPIMIFKK